MNTGRGHHRTPVKFYNWTNERWGPFNMDAACDEGNCMAPGGWTQNGWIGPLPIVGSESKPGLKELLTQASEEGYNGLLGNWFGRVWCNPPWDNIEPWIDKALEELFVGNAILVAMLLPSREGVRWTSKLRRNAYRGTPGIMGRLRYGVSEGEAGGGGFEHSDLWIFENELMARDFN